MPGKRGRPKPGKKSNSNGWTPVAKERLAEFPIPKLPPLSERAFRAIKKYSPEKFALTMEIDEMQWPRIKKKAEERTGQNDLIIRQSPSPVEIREAIRRNIKIQIELLPYAIMHALLELQFHRIRSAMTDRSKPLMQRAFELEAQRVVKQLQEAEKKENELWNAIRNNETLNEMVRIVLERRKK